MDVEIETRLGKGESLARSRIRAKTKGEEEGLLTVMFPKVNGVLPLTAGAKQDEVLVPVGSKKRLLSQMRKHVGIEVERKVPGRKRPVRVVSFHSFRHTFVTEILERGEDVSTAQAAVGHGSPAMTTHYSHSLAASRRAS